MPSVEALFKGYGQLTYVSDLTLKGGLDMYSVKICVFMRYTCIL